MSHDIKFQRPNYLRDIRRFRQEGTPIVYMNQTYIHTLDTTAKRWNDNNFSVGFKKSIGKGQRMIVVNAANGNGYKLTLIF